MPLQKQPGFLLAEDHAPQKAEMLALAMVAVKSADPIDHWVMSWQEGEQPTAEQIEQAIDIFLEETGLDGHVLPSRWPGPGASQLPLLAE